MRTENAHFPQGDAEGTGPGATLGEPKHHVVSVHQCTFLRFDDGTVVMRTVSEL